ncbi:MAG: hypothetical protein Q8M66_08060 [Actinomycetota bacterium]|nr:hypothetical protein [Actinomycetota bacterium]MDZ4180939.1 hypothetical protein [Coriobacteriia bacterium]
MHFTIVLHSGEAENLVGGITYEPCPVVTANGARTTLNHGRPHLEQRDVLTILDAILGVEADPRVPGNAAIVVHESGYGTADDLEKLSIGLRVAGYQVQEVRLDRTHVADGV